MTPKINPEQIFELAKYNNIIYYALKNWEKGRISWEQMLAYCVVGLAQEVEHLRQNVQVISENATTVSADITGFNNALQAMCTCGKSGPGMWHDQGCPLRE